MEKLKLNLKSENLSIDYLTLAISYDDNEKKVKILADYLYKVFGFHSCYSIGNKRKNEVPLFTNLELINLKEKPYFTIRFNYWNQILLEFKGVHASTFYELYKSNPIDFNSFGLTNLNISRLDLFYQEKKSNSSDIKEFDNFLVACREGILYSKTEYIKLLSQPENKKVLGINRRSNARYFRLYRKENYIRFELEIKQEGLNKFQNYFLECRFDLFESELTYFYFKYSINLFKLQLDNHFLTWLRDFNRKHMVQKNDSKLILVTEYFKKSKKLPIAENDDSRLFHLLQFLTFVQNLDNQNYCVHFLEGKKYIITEFFLSDFMQFIELKTTDHRWRRKLKDYFRTLHTAEPIIEKFEDEKFRSFASFPFSEVNKKNNRYIVKVYVIEDLYKYIYPFRFSKSFFK